MTAMNADGFLIVDGPLSKGQYDALKRVLAGGDASATVVIPARNLPALTTIPAMYGVGPDYTAPAPVYTPLESAGNRLAGAAMNGEGEGV